jgi:polysaccharide deacetylase family protein (PEP-CTERM system associated)
MNPMQQPPGQASTTKPLLSLSVDVEDWFMGIELPIERWDQQEPRLEHGLRRILDLLDATGMKATFFILGAVAERHPALIAEIAQKGHEVGSHGFSHSKVYDLTPAAFEDEITRTDAILQEVTGKKPVGFRAPYFSITAKSLWALEILKDHGYLYDSSIYPGSNWRYGIAGSQPTVYKLDNGLVEFPVSTFALGKRRVGIGGAYLRILPLAVTEWAIRKRLEQGELSTVYVHPWEFDPDHPKVKFRGLAMLTHYFYLTSTLPKVDHIVRNHDLIPMVDLLKAHEWLAA